MHRRATVLGLCMCLCLGVCYSLVAASFISMPSQAMYSFITILVRFVTGRFLNNALFKSYGVICLLTFYCGHSRFIVAYERHSLHTYMYVTAAIDLQNLTHLFLRMNCVARPLGMKYLPNLVFLEDLS